MLIHRAYYTPKKLFRFGLRLDANCPRCGEVGDLIHMVWRCPKLVRYWTGVVEAINGTFGTSFEIDVRLCILGYRVWGVEEVTLKTAVLRCLYQARKLITQRWQSVSPPTAEE